MQRIHRLQQSPRLWFGLNIIVRLLIAMLLMDVLIQISGLFFIPGARFFTTSVDNFLLSPFYGYIGRYISDFRSATDLNPLTALPWMILGGILTPVIDSAVRRGKRTTMASVLLGIGVGYLSTLVIAMFPSWGANRPEALYLHIEDLYHQFTPRWLGGLPRFPGDQVITSGLLLPILWVFPAFSWRFPKNRTARWVARGLAVVALWVVLVALDRSLAVLSQLIVLNATFAPGAGRPSPTGAALTYYALQVGFWALLGALVTIAIPYLQGGYRFDIRRRALIGGGVALVSALLIGVVIYLMFPRAAFSNFPRLVNASSQPVPPVFANSMIVPAPSVVDFSDAALAAIAFVVSILSGGLGLIVVWLFLPAKVVEASAGSTIPTPFEENGPTGAVWLPETLAVPAPALAATDQAALSTKKSGPVRYFMSYSRSELYFAEALVNELQGQELDVWFDLQRLVPGSRWQADIQNGLESSDEVIVLVSQRSMQSPWVADEWLHAIAHGKPIHLVLFEAVDFTDHTIQYRDQPLKFDQLASAAQTITDLRVNFERNTKKLIERLRAAQPACDPLPAVNRFRLAARVPLAVAFVNLTIVVLAILSVGITLLTDNVLTFALGTVLTVYLLAEAWRFATRQSYAGSRTVLVIAPILLLAFTPLAIPIVLVALYLSLRNLDIHRHSPNGQGIQRLRSDTSTFGGRSGDALLYVLMAMTALIFVEELLIIPTLILELIIIFYQRPTKISVKGTRAATYELLSAEQDQAIGDDIHRAMSAGGFASISEKGTDGAGRPIPDYTLILITDYMRPTKLRDNVKTIIPILGSPLTTVADVRELLAFQWVDYRRHDPKLLGEMVQDLVSVQDGSKGRALNSFSTRLLPSNFSQLILPRRISTFIFSQIILIQLSIGLMLSQLLVSTNLDPIRVAVQLALVAISYFFTIRLQNRIILREITPRRYTNISIALVFVTQVISAGMTVVILGASSGAIQAYLPFLAFEFAVTLVGYLLFRMVNWSTLRYWLPRRNAVQRSAVATARTSPRNMALWQRNLQIAGFTLLFTLSLFGAPSPAQSSTTLPNSPVYTQRVVEGLRVAVPANWRGVPWTDDLATAACDMPITHLLRRVGNESAALAINGFLFERARDGNAPILNALGKSIDVIFVRIIASLYSRSQFLRYPSAYGNAMYSIAYTDAASCPGGQLSRYVKVTLWQMTQLSDSGPTTAAQLDEMLQLPVQIHEAASATSRQDNIAANSTDVTNAFGLSNQNIHVFQLESTYPPLQAFVMPISTSKGEYFVTVDGDSASLNTQHSVIEQILQSIGEN